MDYLFRSRQNSNRRRQRHKVRDIVSHQWYSQGSVLWPILFLLYTADVALIAKKPLLNSTCRENRLVNLVATSMTRMTHDAHGAHDARQVRVSHKACGANSAVS